MPVVLIAMLAASAIAQYQNSQEAAKQNKAQMEKLNAIYEKLQAPGFDPNSLTPADYKLVGKYVPVAAAHIQEINPKLVELSGAGQVGQDAQRQALQQMQQVAGSRNNPELQAMTDQAMERGQQEAQSRSQSLMNQYAHQGLLGSGTQLAAQLSGNQSAMQNASAAGQNSAVEAYRQRLAALQGSAQLGGQMVSQDQAMQSRNADIINAFNQRATQNAQQYQNYLAGQQNDAQMQNLNAAQGIANMNTQQGNAYKQYLQSLKQQDFNNQMAVAQGKAGNTSMNIGLNNQSAQDKNAAIQGGTNAATSGYMYSGQQDENEKNRQTQLEIAKMKYGNNQAYNTGPRPSGAHTEYDENGNPIYSSTGGGAQYA